MQATITCEHCPTKLTVEAASLVDLAIVARRQGWAIEDPAAGGVRCPSCQSGKVEKSDGMPGDDRLDGGRRAL